MTKKKRVLLHVTSSLRMGGAEQVLCDLIKHLGSDAFDHHVIYFHGGPNVERLRALGVKLYHIKGLFCMYDLLFFVRFFITIKKVKPNILHSLLWAANVATRIAGAMLRIPTVSVFHNNVDQDGALRNLLDRATIPLAHKLVAVSEGVEQSLSLHGTTRAVQVIPNGVDCAMVQRKSMAQNVNKYALGLLDEHFVIGSVGRFNPVKNYRLLLESFADVAHVHAHARLVLVGVGPQEQWLRTYATTLNIAHKVVFVVGQQSYGYYPLFDCFALSSDKEGISIALLEAMSFGLPCVVTFTTKTHQNTLLTQKTTSTRSRHH